MSVNWRPASPIARLATLAAAFALAVAACEATPVQPTPTDRAGERASLPAARPSQASSPRPTASHTRPSPTPAAATARWDTLLGGDAAFSDAWVSAVVPGPDGILAFGSDRASGLPVAWRSDDGIRWTRAPLAPTTFGGGAPRSVTVGPAGWLAIGWRITPADPLGAALWRSDDGTHWEPDGEGPAPAPQLEIGAVLGSAGGYLLKAGGDSDGAPPRTWASVDGRHWSPSDPPGAASVDRVLASGTDILAVGLPTGAENSKWWPWAMWRFDPRTGWAPVPLPPGTENGSPDLQVAVSGGAILVGLGVDGDITDDDYEPIQQLYLSRDGAHWEAGGTLPVFPPGAAVSLWGIDGGWIAVDDESHTRIGFSADGRSWTALDTAGAGEGFGAVVPIGPGRALVMGRLSGLPIGILGDTTPPSTTLLVTGDRPVAPAVDPNRVDLAVPPGTSCPARPHTVAALERIPGWLAAACFGRTTLRLTGWVAVHGLGCGDACPTTDTVFDSSLGLGLGTRRDREWFLVFYDPASVTFGARVRRAGFAQFHAVIEGAFDSPAAETCARHASPAAAAVLRCRERFVVTALTHDR